ncbi:MAG: PAS domain S-box protein [Smithella sp.]|jgi:PAS domain S-box-containing protein
MQKHTNKISYDKEQLFRFLTEQSSDIILLVDRNGIITYENKAVEEVLGYKPQERIGGSSFDNLHPDELESVKRGFNKLFKDIHAPVFRSEARIRHKDGHWRMFEIIGSILPHNNVVESVIVNLRDITERKLVEEKLRESEASYRQLFDNSPAAIYRVDFKKGTFLKANDVFCQRYGCKPEEVTSLSPYDVLTEESKKLFLERLEKMSLGIKVPETVEYEVLNKKGQRLYLQLHNKNIYDAEGNVIASDVVAHDITERKQAEEELKRFAKNLEDANTAMRVLMNRRDEDRKEIEDKLQTNIKNLVIPYLKMLNHASLDNRYKHYLNVLENNLKEVLSPFMKNILSLNKNLTPQEIQIVDLIKQGKNTKEIAGMLNASPNTIATHRNNIREKLNLRNAKVNLRSYLQSIS